MSNFLHRAAALIMALIFVVVLSPFVAMIIAAHAARRVLKWLK